MPTPSDVTLNTLDTHICILNREGVIVFVNETWSHLAVPGEGTHFLDICEQRGIDLDQIIEPLSQLLTKERTAFEVEYTTPDSRSHLVQFTRVPEECPGNAFALVIHQDVTERKEEKHKQSQAEEDIQQVVNIARCLPWSGTVLRMKDDQLWWNLRFHDEAAALKLFPIEHDPDKGFMWSLYLARPAEDRKKSDGYGTAKVLAGENYSQEFRCRLADGSYLWLQDDVRVEGVADGLWKIMGLTTDITRQKEAEDAFAHIMRSTNCLLWHATITDETLDGAEEPDLRWELSVVNEDAARRFFPVEQAPGETYTKAWERGRFWEENHLHALESVLQCTSYSQEFRWHGLDGEVRWLKEDVQVEPLGERRWRAVGVCTDITQQKQQEELLRAQEQHFRLALEGGELGSWHIDLAQGRFLHVSPHLREMIGIPLEGEFLWEDFVQKIYPEDQATVFTAISAALESRENSSVEFRTIRPDGSLRWLGSHGHVLLDVEGRATQLIGVTRDITEHKRLEEAQAQALFEAQERADRDPLTGLLNHRAFHKRLEEECARAKRESTTLAVVMLDLDNFKFFNDVYGHLVGDQVLCQVAERLRETCRSYDTLSRFGGDEFALILSNTGTSAVPEVEARLREHLRFSFQPEGYPSPIPITVSLGATLYPNNDDEDKGWHELIHLADKRLLRAKTGGVVERDADQTRALMSQAVEGFSMLDALVAAVDNKDRYTKRHSEDVMAYSLQLAQALGASEDLQQTIAAAALLHDVGKIGIPDAILRKPGKLTDKEFEAIKLHPTMGAAIVGAVAGLEDTLDAIRYHHERWDGKGYPKGTVGEETPWIARLMAVTDAFSAMTTDRPYRQGLSPTCAVAILEQGAGTQWDPEMVTAFLRCHPQK